MRESELFLTYYAGPPREAPTAPDIRQALANREDRLWFEAQARRRTKELKDLIPDPEGPRTPSRAWPSVSRSPCREAVVVHRSLRQ